MNTPVFLLKFLELQLNARRSPEGLAQRQLMKFRRFAGFAGSRSPYYGRIIKDRRIDVSACTPADFPVLTKGLLMEHFDEIVTERARHHAGPDRRVPRAVEGTPRSL